MRRRPKNFEAHVDPAIRGSSLFQSEKRRPTAFRVSVAVRLVCANARWRTWACRSGQRDRHLTEHTNRELLHRRMPMTSLASNLHRASETNEQRTGAIGAATEKTDQKKPAIGTWIGRA